MFMVEGVKRIFALDFPASLGMIASWGSGRGIAVGFWEIIRKPCNVMLIL